MRLSSTVFGNLTQNGAVWRAKPPNYFRNAHETPNYFRRARETLI